MQKSRLILGAAFLCLAGAAAAQTTNPDRPATTTDRPGASTSSPSTSSPGVTSTTPSSPSSPSAAPSYSPPPSSSAAPAPSAPMASDTRTTTTETRTYRDPVTGRMVNEPARMDTARAPRADRN